MQKLWTTNVGSNAVATYPQAVELFFLRCRSRNLSPHSLLWYKSLLKGFIGFLEASGASQLRQTTPNHLRAYLDYLRQRGLSSITIDRTFGGLRCFFRYMTEERLIPQNPTTLVEKPKKSKVLIRPLSMDQVRLLLAQPDLKTFLGLRNRVLMLLMLDSGLRLSEALGLRLVQVDLKVGEVLVMGKGRKERKVPFADIMRRALEAYLKKRSKVEASVDLLFVGRGGGRLTSRHIQIMVRRYGRAAGIEGVRISPHTLRHTFATQYIRNGGDAFSLQAIRGHSTLEMVRNYVNLASRDVAAQHRKFSPMDRLLSDQNAV